MNARSKVHPRSQAVGPGITTIPEPIVVSFGRRSAGGGLSASSSARALGDGGGVSNSLRNRSRLGLRTGSNGGQSSDDLGAISGECGDLSSVSRVGLRTGGNGGQSSNNSSAVGGEGSDLSGLGLVRSGSRGRGRSSLDRLNDGGSTRGVGGQGDTAEDLLDGAGNLITCRVGENTSVGADREVILVAASGSAANGGNGGGDSSVTLNKGAQDSSDGTSASSRGRDGASTTSSNLNTSLAAERKAIGDNSSGLLRVADSSGAVTETVDEVLVGAQAANITSVTSKLLGLGSADHVASTSLLWRVSGALLGIRDFDLHHTGGGRRSSEQRRQQQGRKR
ncbi:hypothetical protein HG531_003464 [Fusarium graminearum]|nr:hypothetical protein HG531_003464 [Fusarium graminearum]